MNRAIPPLLVALALVVGAASSIIIRHDQDDAAYLALGEQFSQELVHLNLEKPGNPPDGEGTLIAPRWVLTAAHVGVGVTPGHMLTIAGADYEAEAAFMHPAWDEGATNDIALIQLKRPVEGVDPVALYPHLDEVGRIVTMVGRGDLGTGLTGPTGNDGRVRGATNKIDGADELLLWWRFDAPGDSTGNATPLEGISGPGDSGGPAFLDVAGRRYLVGVSSSQSTRATGGRNGLYGVTEYYVRISGYRDWIAQILEANR